MPQPEPSHMRNQECFLKILENILIITDYNTVNVLKSTLALLHNRECGTPECYTASKKLAVGS